MKQKALDELLQHSESVPLHDLYGFPVLFGLMMHVCTYQWEGVWRVSIGDRSGWCLVYIFKTFYGWVSQWPGEAIALSGVPDMYVKHQGEAFSPSG